MDSRRSDPGSRRTSTSLTDRTARDGSYFPSLLEPRRRTERVLLAVVQEAYVLGVSTRRVDDLARALGIENISGSEVSRMCAALDAEVAAFRCRPLTDVAVPYLWLDATYVKVREAGRVLGLELARRQRRGQCLAPVRVLARRAPACTACGWSSATTTRAWSRPSASSSWARAGNDAGSIPRATPRTSCPGRPGA